MKKLFALVMVLSLALGLAAYAGNIEPPTVGFKVIGSATDQYGRYSFDDNGNVYRLVLNNTVATAEYGWPAWYITTEANSYTVKSSYEATTDLEQFAGIWRCDTAGSTTIHVNTYGWVQTAGYCVASAEGTTDILGNDLLIGATTGKYLVKGRATLVDLNVASDEAAATTYGARSLEHYTTNAVKGIKIRLLGLM